MAADLCVFCKTGDGGRQKVILRCNHFAHYDCFESQPDPSMACLLCNEQNSCWVCTEDLYDPIPNADEDRHPETYLTYLPCGHHGHIQCVGHLSKCPVCQAPTGW